MPKTGFRNIFAFLAPGREWRPSAAATVALTLASAAKGHLTVRVGSLHFGAPFSLAPELQEAVAPSRDIQTEEGLKQAADAVSDRAVELRLSHDVAPVVLQRSELFGLAAQQARIHDITIVDHAVARSVAGRALVEEFLFDTGRPVLLVSDKAASAEPARIMIAWDGTARAARAAHDALPFLIRAKTVELVSVNDEQDNAKLPSGSEAAPHLARHGVEVLVSGLNAIGKETGAVLREHARITGAQMIVMGAYAHSRLRELIIGGATDSMLNEADVTLFMAH